MAGSIDSKTIVTIFKNQYIGSPEVAKFVADLLAAQAAQDKLNKTQKESSKISKDQQKN